MSRSTLLCPLFLLLVVALPADADDWKPDEGFTSLYNGRDLTGWCYTDNNKEDKFDGKTEAGDGRFVAKGDSILVNAYDEAKGPRTRKLWTAQKFPQDFILKLEFRAAVNSDSGIFFRGPQLQCRDYLVAGPYKDLKKYKPQDWNTIVVTVKAAVAHCECNGEVLEDALKLPETGPFGLEADRGQMEYRRIQIKEIPPTQYNVRTFGATGDGKTKDTAAFQKALDICAVNGGGEVVVPAGNYLIGSVQMGHRTFLRLEKDSILTGSPDLTDYPVCDVRWEGRWQQQNRGLIYASNVDHTGIVGPGRIDGNPASPRAGGGPVRGAVVLEPINCNDVRWEDFSLTQGGTWATHPTYCTDVVIKNLKISSGRDGIDVDSCKNVRIEGCDIDTGDDCISLKSGRGMDGARIAKPTEDVLITNCTMRGRSFACIGIGSETSGGIRNIRIEHCKMNARSQGVYIKTRIGRAGFNDNIIGEDLDILAGGFLRINLIGGGNTSTADDPVEGLVGYPTARNLSFNNIRLNNATFIVQATDVSQEKPVEGLKMTNISGTAAKGITMQHVRNAVLSDIKVTGFQGEMLMTNDVSGTGLEGAVTYTAPPPATARGGRGGGAGRGANAPATTPTTVP